MHTRPDRYLAFVDYLVTRELYRDSRTNAELLEDRANELEHGIQVRLQGPLAARRIEIGVFSDTVLIAGRGIEDVLSASASLLEFVLRKSVHRSDPTDIR